MVATNSGQNYNEAARLAYLVDAHAFVMQDTAAHHLQNASLAFETDIPALIARPFHDLYIQVHDCLVQVANTQSSFAARQVLRLTFIATGTPVFLSTPLFTTENPVQMEINELLAVADDARYGNLDGAQCKRGPRKWSQYRRAQPAARHTPVYGYLQRQASLRPRSAPETDA